MANIFSNFGNKLGNAFTNLGQGGNLFNADPTQIATLSDEDKKRFKQQGLQRLADSFMVAGAIGSGDAQRIALAQNQIRQRKVEEKNAEQERQMQEAFANNPELLKIANVFGKGAAFQEMQRQNNAEIKFAQQQKQNQGLKEAGFSDREINLFVNAGMKADDILALRDQGSNKKTIEELNDEVLDSKENVSDGLKNLDAAFGVVDTVKGAAAKYLGPVSPIQIAPVTTSANAARNTLNERVREKFLSEYSGRPSVYLNVRIDALLPQGSYSTELEAKQKYQEVRRVLKEGLAEMESKIQSNVYKEDELIEVQEQYKDIQSVVKDLDVGINALSKNSSETSSNETSSGSYDSFYTGG